MIEIILHGTRDDVDKCFYEFELTSPTGEIIWKKTARFLITDNVEENNKIASRKIAEKLYYERLKAQKNHNSPN